jgi:PPOX class probable F420-dependent enzyme
MNSTDDLLQPFDAAWAAVLTSFRRDGTPVPTLVNVAVVGDRAYIRTYGSAGKLKRIRRNPAVELAPATWRGRPTGDAIHATARILDGGESEAAGRAIDAKHPYFQRRLVRFGHRVKRDRTVHLELVPEAMTSEQRLSFAA